MRTVADFIAAQASLCVTCHNCGRQELLSPRFLKARLGFTGNVLKAPYRCSTCRRSNVRLAAATGEAAGRRLRRMTYFAGVYSKYED